jgi:UDP-glucose 4-epimerase
MDEVDVRGDGGLGGHAGAPRRRPASRAARRPRGGVVAVLGVHTPASRRLLRRLEDDERYAKLVLVDVRAPSAPIRRAVFERIDLTEPLADGRLADVLRREQVEVLIHTALHDQPSPSPGSARDLETVGTMVVLNAAADRISSGGALRRLVVLSSAMVYGANVRNPNFLTEDMPLRGGAEPGFVRDKVDVERQLEAFRSEVGLAACVLRPCWTVGADASSGASLLAQSRALTVLGFDPPLQLLHIDDLADALKRAVDGTVEGAFNVAPRGVLRLSSALRLAGCVPLPLPGPLAYPLAEILWRSYGAGIGVSLDFLRYCWTVDAAKLEAKLGAAPRFTTREAVELVARRA